MTKKLQWRLSNLPTPSELTELVNNGIITKEEAKEMIVSEVDERDAKSLKEEIKFLRTLVEKLSNHTKVVEVIKTIEKQWQPYPWYQPYCTWTTGTQITNAVGGAGSVALYSNTLSGSTASGLAVNNQTALTSSGFSGIQTF